MTPANDNSLRPQPASLLGRIGRIGLTAPLEPVANAAGHCITTRIDATAAAARRAGRGLGRVLSWGGYQHSADVTVRTLPRSCGKDGRVSAYAAPVAARPQFEGWA